MDRFYLFIIRNDIWIYFLCGLGLVWYFFQLWQARRLLRQAMFGLEQERGRLSQRTSLVALLLLILIIGGVTYVNLEVAPTLPPELLRPPTPTPNIFATPFFPASSDGTPRPGRTPTLAVAPTVTLRGESNSPIFDDSGSLGTPTSSPTPTLPAISESCTNQIAITSPPTGINTAGPVTFFGTANDPDFSRFDLQALGPQTDGDWRSLLDTPSTSPVLNSILGRFNFETWISGDYIIRIIVTNPTNEVIGECGIQITITGN